MNFNHKFFTFFKPVFDYLEGQDLYKKPFVWFYAVIAVLNLLFPLILIYMIIFRAKILDWPFKEAIVGFFIWAVIAIAAWVSFQLWWDRKSKIHSEILKSEKFVATPVFSHFIKTYGEWSGIWVGIVGFGFGLFTTLFLGAHEARMLSNELGIGFFNPGPITMILMPLLGLIIIIFSRFLSEIIKALASIAINTERGGHTEDQGS